MRRFGPVLWLTLYAAAFSVVAFGRGLPAFDDHPGQYFRLWHFLERSLPDGRWTADWNPDWWGGYPELQFYPPGYALAGLLIRLLALWQLSPETVYQLVCAAILALPALTTLVLLAAVLGDGWLALPSAFLALVLSAGLRAGVEEGLRWGMLATRLSAGLLPLLLLSLRPWVEAGRPPPWAPLVASAAILSHPASIPVVLVILALAAFFGAARASPRSALATGAIVLVLTGALGAFWLVPLSVRQRWLVALTWGHPPGAGSVAGIPVSPVVLGVGAAALLAWIPALGRRRPFEVFLATLPLALLGLAAVNAALFTRGVTVIEPGRLADAVVTAAIAAGGLAFGALAARAIPRARGAGRPVLALGTVALLALAMVVLPRAHSEPVATLWPRSGDWPSAREIEASEGLPRLWSLLGRSPDRILFTTSSLRLGRDPAWYAPHSHLTSLAPLRTGREIVHGTYTHPSPLAARFYTGSPAPPRLLRALAEELDGRSLLGERWEGLTPEAFDAFARRLRVATVVVPTPLVSRARFLAPHYTASGEAAGLTVFERRDRPWPRIERITHRRYRVAISPTGGVWIPTGLAAYPLWQAKSRQGVLETRADAWGLLEFRVPLDVFEAELVYSEGPLEWLSLGVSALGLLAWAGWFRHARQAPSRRPSPAPSALGRRRRRPRVGGGV